MAPFNLLPELPVSYWALGFLSVSIYAALKAAYRLYFHPLRHIPGPKLAAMTFWYEMYYDIFLDGQYTFRIKELHKQYGPILRISPEEVHISSPDFYNTVFAPSVSLKTRQAPKRHKWIRFVQVFGHPELSAFGTTDHDKHKMRRGAMERFFSPAMVKKLAPTLILQKVETLCKRLEEEGKKGPVRIKLACSCFTTDVISDYALGRGFDYLNHPTFFPEWSDVFINIGRAGNLLKPWPFIFRLMDSLPDSIAKILNPGLAATVQQNNESRKLIEAIKKGKDKDYINSRSHPSIFHELLNSGLPPEEKRVERLQGDGQAVIGAGTETTATILATGIVRILSNPEVESKLRKELKAVMPDPTVLASLSILEKLPYLSAVIKEALRVGYGICGRCGRVADEPIQFENHIIPPGTSITMSAALMHMDESVFPDPERFDPERWTDAKESSRLYRYLVSFSKGPRMCIGINLAYAELYMGLASLFRRFDMKLYDTSEDDLELVVDIFVPVFKKDHKDFRITTTPVEE